LLHTYLVIYKESSMSPKSIHNCTLKKAGNEPFGFRIIGGTDQGKTFQIEKVLTGHPASYGGLEELDFLITVRGQEVFDMDHAQVVKLIKTAGPCLNLQVERGEWIVPNFEEIWPSGKPRRRNKGPGIPTKGPEYIEYAMKTGIPGEKDKDFTTVGKPKVTTNQYDNPIECYSEETLEEMTETGTTWQKTEATVASVAADPTKFNPTKSAVLKVLQDSERGDNFQR